MTDAKLEYNSAIWPLLHCKMMAEPANFLEIRMARLEGAYKQTNLRLTRLEGGLNRLEDKLEFRSSHIDRKLDTYFNVLAWPFGGLGFVIWVS